jgi:acetyltransferase-like isoleucine patch superfamily enzyme
VAAHGDALSDALRALHRDLRQDMRERYDRDLPLDEMMFDRWERARALGFGVGTSVYHNTYVLGEVRVAGNVWIGPMVMLDGSGGGIDIGEWCCISAGAQLYTHDTVARSLTGGRAERHSGPVRVGARSYVGSGAVIVPGVTIGDHSVIGAGSVVTGDVPPFSAAVGVPARVRGRVAVDERAGTAAIDWDA